MQQLTGKDKDTLVNDLQGVIFADPLEKNSDGEPRYYTADEYLSGDVRHKLQVAKLAAQNNPAFAVNVQALETVQPKDLEASEIAVRLGATWLAPELIKQFADELVDAPYYVRDRVKVLYIPLTGVWNVTNKSFTGGNIKATVTYGTQRANFYHILEESLNLRDVRVFDTKEDMQGNKIRVLNAAATQEAQMKQQQIEDAFKDWIWKDPTRRQMLVKEYNERFNSLRPREYDGSHILFHGMSPEITLRPHQKNAIAHILYGGNTLLAHVVGAGKTYEMVAAAMEKKRLGLCSKTLICVPNHLTEQLAGEALQLYPNANILVARRTDFEKANRKRFCAKIATGNYDIIVIGHSQFERIPLSQERQVEYLQSQIHDVISQELPGAELIITNKDGKVVEHWTSTDKPHYIEKLPAGEYTLTEITAPNGYEIAEDIPFTVLPTGEVQRVVMKDAPIPEQPVQPTPPTTPTPTPLIPQTGDTSRWDCFWRWQVFPWQGWRH